MFINFLQLRRTHTHNFSISIQKAALYDWDIRFYHFTPSYIMVLLSILVLKCVKISCTFGAHTYIILLSAYRRLLFTIEIFVFTILPRVMILCSILLLKCVKISCALSAHPYKILPSAYRRLLFIIKIKRYLFLPYYPELLDTSL